MHSGYGYDLLILCNTAAPGSSVQFVHMSQCIVTIKAIGQLTVFQMSFNSFQQFPRMKSSPGKTEQTNYADSEGILRKDFETRFSQARLV